MEKWLATDESTLPKSLDAVGRWADNARKRLTELFPTPTEGPPFGHMLQSTGILIVDRRNLLAEQFDLQMEANEPLPTIIIREMPSTLAAIKLLREGRMTPTFGMIIERSSCSRCHNDYATCACIKHFGPNTWEDIEDFKLAGVYWTNRAIWKIQIKIVPATTSEN